MSEKIEVKYYLYVEEREEYISTTLNDLKHENAELMHIEFIFKPK